MNKKEKVLNKVLGNSKFNHVGYKNSNNYWWKHEYDDNHNIVKEINSNGFIVNKEYNDNGYLVKHSDSLGVIKIFKYDERNNLSYIETTCKDKIIDAYWAEYDEKDLMIYEKRDGYDTFYKYNENGDIINKTLQNGISYDIEYEYTDNVKKEHKVYSNGKESWKVIDATEHSKSFRDTDGYSSFKKCNENNDIVKYQEASISESNSYEYEYTQEYDENNNLTHFKQDRVATKTLHGPDESTTTSNITCSEVFNTYDDNNNHIYSINPDTKFEELFEYDKNNNLIHYKNSSGIEYWNEWEAVK